MYVSDSTVKTHISHIYRKFDVHGRQSCSTPCKANSLILSQLNSSISRINRSRIKRLCCDVFRATHA
ncbi:LuxR C-terminal-related transcriptional regulator [uncultured Slackia sp.]|uniref:LuxR C-terminal-related transcriptional regulator n=1 Tax=uncultured Slackia sp. TaxID=665903 RepID=UPI00258C959C|nr:LuxR C-terminal-related transcriptional regulator [uncultured Slackia sp.]